MMRFVAIASGANPRERFENIDTLAKNSPATLQQREIIL